MYNLKLELDTYRKIVDCDSFVDHALDRVLNPKNELDYYLAVYMIGAIDIYGCKHDTSVLNPFNIDVLCSWKVPLYPLEHDFIIHIDSKDPAHILHENKLDIKFYKDNVIRLNGIFLGNDRLSEIEFRPSQQVIYERSYSMREFMIRSTIERLYDTYLESRQLELQESRELLGQLMDNTNGQSDNQNRTGVYSEALMDDKDLSEYIPTGKKVSVEDIDDLIKNIDSIIAESAESAESEDEGE